jgi:hypothetical protein
MIESVDLVLTALVAGTSAGLSETATAAIEDSHRALKAVTGKVLCRSQPDSDLTTIDDQLTDPETYHDELVAALTTADLKAHPELIEAAQRVLDLVEPQQKAMGKYSVVITDSTGVQVGDGSSMTIQIPK